MYTSATLSFSSTFDTSAIHQSFQNILQHFNCPQILIQVNMFMRGVIQTAVAGAVGYDGGIRPIGADHVHIGGAGFDYKARLSAVGANGLEECTHEAD